MITGVVREGSCRAGFDSNVDEHLCSGSWALCSSSFRNLVIFDVFRSTRLPCKAYIGSVGVLRDPFWIVDKHPVITCRF